VVEHLEDMPSAGEHQRVVERGAQVNKNQGDREDGATDDIRGRPTRGRSDEIDSAHHGQDRANAVRDGVGQNVAEFGLGRHRSMIARGRAALHLVNAAA